MASGHPRPHRRPRLRREEYTAAGVFIETLDVGRFLRLLIRHSRSATDASVPFPR